MIANNIAVHIHLVTFIKSVIAELTARPQIALAGIDHVRFLIGAVVKLNFSQRLPVNKHAPQTNHVRLCDARRRLKTMQKCIVRNPSAGHPKGAFTNLIPPADNMKTSLFMLCYKLRNRALG